MATLTRVVVDTSTLEAICKTDRPEPVFQHLPLCTTDICFEELRRNESMADSYQRKESIRQALALRREFDTPTLVPTGMEYNPYVDDQGEESIIRAELESERRCQVHTSV